jgi:hypothetical protein
LNVLFIFGFLALVATIGGLVYVLLIQSAVPGIAEQRFGKLEALPPNVGKWTSDSESAEGREAAKRGLTREVRHFYDVQSGKLTRQARYRSRATNAITGVDADVPVLRRRIRG